LAIARLTNVYGEDDRGRVIPIFVERALRAEPLVLYGGTQIVDFVHVTRVIQALGRLGIGSRFEGPVNVGSGTGIRIARLAREVVRIAASRSSLRIEPARAFEVDRFVADVSLLADVSGVPAPRDPLEELPSVIAARCAAGGFTKAAAPGSLNATAGW
jgi:UDP-glucose 4-epimerase